MESTLIAVDTAKLVFEVPESARGKVAASAAESGGIRRLSRATRACRIRAGSLRRRSSLDASDAVLRPPCSLAARVPYVCAYRRRNKTGRVDCLAMLEAAKNSEILPVPVKSPEHQAIQGLHRCRSAWMETRTARINTLRGLLRELTATALYASTNDAIHFRDGRHLASWLGLTPREHSSGSIRKLGGISKRGDRYVRMLMVHGARSVLLRARQMQRAGYDLNALQRRALALKDRTNHNKATCALANKIARIAWATWRHGTVFDSNQAAAA